MVDVDAELGQISGRDAGGIAGGRRGALHFTLRKQGLENGCRGESRIDGRPGERNEDLRDLLEAIHHSQSLHHIADLAIYR